MPAVSPPEPARASSAAHSVSASVAIGDSTNPAPKDASPSPPTGNRVLVVQAGDSLWSIAKRLLGPDASPAEIARKVSRLWDINEDRIGTGRPDLLLVGTKLKLR